MFTIAYLIDLPLLPALLLQILSWGFNCKWNRPSVFHRSKNGKFFPNSEFLLKTFRKCSDFQHFKLIYAQIVSSVTTVLYYFYSLFYFYPISTGSILFQIYSYSISIPILIQHSFMIQFHILAFLLQMLFCIRINMISM